MSSMLYFNVSVDIHCREQEIYSYKKNQNVIHCLVKFTSLIVFSNQH